MTANITMHGHNNQSSGTLNAQYEQGLILRMNVAETAAKHSSTWTRGDGATHREYMSQLREEFINFRSRVIKGEYHPAGYDLRNEQSRNELMQRLDARVREFDAARSKVPYGYKDLVKNTAYVALAVLAGVAAYACKTGAAQAIVAAGINYFSGGTNSTIAP